MEPTPLYMTTGVAQRQDEIGSESARAWAARLIKDVPYLYMAQLRGVLEHRKYYKTMMRLDDADFQHGVYLALCDKFGGGCELEDLPDDACLLLGLPLTGIKSNEQIARERSEAARERKQAEYQARWSHRR